MQVNIVSQAQRRNQSKICIELIKGDGGGVGFSDPRYTVKMRL